MSDIEYDSGSDFNSASSANSSMDSNSSATRLTISSRPLSDSTNNAANDIGRKVTSTGSGASEHYQKLTQLEHILKRPDTYIGSVEKSASEMWCFDAESEQMVFKEVNIVPGLYKIFDEILVNAADNKIRDPLMRNLKVKIDSENNQIEVMNDGKGIPVEIHEKEKIYIPELIFGNLLTSSNYDDDQKKVTGGRNGYGAKLCNIFSTEFTVETADLNTGKVYEQKWSDNMSKISKPKITKLKTKKEYTKITFKPDLSKFHMDSLDGEILSVMRRRVYDLCGTVKDCNIYLNDKKINIKNFKGYVEMYVKAIADKKEEQNVGLEQKNYQTIVHEVINDRWEVAFAVSDGTFNQVSFVNSIATTSGGTHVKCISDQIVTKLMEAIAKKEKSSKNMIKAYEVRSRMFLFINSLIENPAFTSQTKEQLTTRVSEFGGNSKGKVLVSDQFINKIMKTSIIDEISSILQANKDKAMQQADGTNKKRIRNLVKLVDANKAGTKQGYMCTLILTEGDSAKSLAVAGLSVVGRDYYGCFPLKGKLLNVREASTDQISKNTEINALKQIMGLKHKKVYDQESIKTLRYGSIMIMTDQDHDGSHIKGLIINFLETSFPGLLEIPGFLLEFITPIVKVTIKKRGKDEVIPFYNMPNFETWRETEGKLCRWTHKYYKGLGTSTLTEAREYFAALDRHRKVFHTIEGDDKQFIDLAFSKKRADDRKKWLQGFQPGTHLDLELEVIPISDFINKELILFSMADNIRSIPSMLDGFKPGQRKVLFGCFKKNLKNQIRVSQLVGQISEITGYHHGEESLVHTVIGLAQDFIGSNNVNYLMPIGSFGTRDAGGKDFSAPRYIFTAVSDITHLIFNKLDNPLYEYVQDDEQTVEPTAYLPVLPMILVNGAEGIGTGWSTNIPLFNPTDIISNIRKLMNNEEMEEMTPWFRGWEGDMERISKDRYKVMGKIRQIDETTLEITELPVKTWTNNMKEFLLAALGNDSKPWIRDMEERHGLKINFLIKLSKEEMEKSLNIGLLERFKLISHVNLSNMVTMDPNGKIKKYESPLEIIRDYYYVRLEYYQRRKDFMSQEWKTHLIRLSEQARFIKLIIDKKISVSNKKRAEIVDILKENGFKRFDKNGKLVEQEDEVLFVDPEELFEEAEDEMENLTQAGAEPSGEGAGVQEHIPETQYSHHDYLLGMSIWSLTRERYEKLLKQRDEKEQELSILLSKSAKDLWNEDLDAFLEGWEVFLKEDLERRSAMIPNTKSKTKGKRRRANEDSGNSRKKQTSKTPKIEPVDDTEVKTVTKEKTPPKKSAPVVKREKQPDLLSFFSSESEPLERQDTRETSNRSLFNDSDDDLLLLKASLSNKTKTKPAAVSASVPTSAPTSVPSNSKKRSQFEDSDEEFSDQEMQDSSDSEDAYVE